MNLKLKKYAQEAGLTIEEAKADLKVRVVSSDVKGADRKDPMSCGFARACKRADKGIVAAYFFKTTAWLEYKDRIVRFTLPTSVQKEIVSFDRSRILEPGDYQLKAPSPKRTLEAQRTLYQPRRKRGRNAAKRPTVTKHVTGLVRVVD